MSLAPASQFVSHWGLRHHPASCLSVPQSVDPASLPRLSLFLSRPNSLLLLTIHPCQVRSEKVLTQTDLKGALVGTSGDFSTSKLSRLVNHRSRNQLVLAAYLEHCTEPAPSDGSPHSPEQWQEHEERLSVRGRQVNAALQIKSQRQQGKFRSVLEQRAASSSPSWQPLSGLDGMESVDEGHLSLEEYLWQQQGGQSFGEEDSEEEEEEEAPAADIYPLPADVDGAALTGGLSMAGRRALRRKTIAFAVDIQHAEAMNAAFNVAGRAAWR